MLTVFGKSLNPEHFVGIVVAVRSVIAESGEFLGSQLLVLKLFAYSVVDFEAGVFDRLQLLHFYQRVIDVPPYCCVQIAMPHQQQHEKFVKPYTEGGR
ncbi:unnamed protein product [Schistosoma mattheei]|uniref:Uncharacterized protein n=1 Tax=Schistosoma mattheei TaxID=31246 RepID=A0A183NM37_9TREM|nr:unnamed protein product [Schistosoma mattheei]